MGFVFWGKLSRSVWQVCRKFLNVLFYVGALRSLSVREGDICYV